MNFKCPESEIMEYVFYIFKFLFFRDDLEEIDNLYGLTKKRFNYANAPKRGWQEDKKDFSHKKSYIKYHESEEEQPYSVPR